jgi:hypothetical protein
VPYAPRGNAMFSIVGLSFVSAFYWGALSPRIGGFGWGGTAHRGLVIGLWAQILIFTATCLSYAMGIETSYFRHWDASTCRRDDRADGDGDADAGRRARRRPADRAWCRR